MDESRKMNHLKLYEDFGQSEGRVKDPKIGEIANNYLNKILKGNIKYEQVDPRKGEFQSDFDDSDGQTEAELTYAFKNEDQKDAHIAVEFTWTWEFNYGRNPEQTMDRFQKEREDESILTGVKIDSANYHSDGGLDGDFDIDDENKKLLQEYLEKNLPVTKIRIFKLQ